MSVQPLEVEVVTHVLGSMDHCAHCQVFIDGAGVGGRIKQDDLDSFPKEWMAEWQQLSDLILTLAERHAGQLVIRITDARSPAGLWKALRHGVRRYPTFIVGDDRYHGWDQGQIETLIHARLAR